ncbi:mitochondrial carrier domain-containing protein [Staphylotrichum tortipilum]|uniref:Mitochondrial carrier domain-containing protein n=1 Tax=Staphylotrichum tortipilum TaxID=2831512 RepID=A0AAN6RUM6_9PEZI|nr:mitochondrial carrier domain-containing protein [Staphylotrichum longicolle]
MSADFWAGYLSGAAGIILGNPLDVLKVRLQAGLRSPASTTPSLATSPHPPGLTTPTKTPPFFLGTAAPILGYGALNALLFVSYNRATALLTPLSPPTPDGRPSLTTAWLAGAVGGLATWAVSTPTELIKCRAQLQVGGSVAGETISGGGGKSSWAITQQILRAKGVRGLFAGGGVTALRDSIGYGFYFWGYELCSRAFHPGEGGGGGAGEAARVLLCGGLAGIITWASIFPLDVVKTRVQTQTNLFVAGGSGEGEALLGAQGKKPMGAWEVARETYRAEGVRPFFRGLGVCSARAFIVNAVQWAVYEWIMRELGAGRKLGGEVGGAEVVLG